MCNGSAAVKYKLMKHLLLIHAAPEGSKLSVSEEQGRPRWDSIQAWYNITNGFHAVWFLFATKLGCWIDRLKQWLTHVRKVDEIEYHPTNKRRRLRSAFLRYARRNQLKRSTLSIFTGASNKGKLVRVRVKLDWIHASVDRSCNHAYTNIYAPCIHDHHSSLLPQGAI